MKEDWRVILDDIKLNVTNTGIFATLKDGKEYHLTQIAVRQLFKVISIPKRYFDSCNIISQKEQLKFSSRKHSMHEISLVVDTGNEEIITVASNKYKLVKDNDFVDTLEKISKDKLLLIDFEKDFIAVGVNIKEVGEWAFGLYCVNSEVGTEAMNVQEMFYHIKLQKYFIGDKIFKKRNTKTFEREYEEDLVNLYKKYTTKVSKEVSEILYLLNSNTKRVNLKSKMVSRQLKTLYKEMKENNEIEKIMFIGDATKKLISIGKYVGMWGRKYKVKVGKIVRECLYEYK